MATTLIGIILAEDSPGWTWPDLVRNRMPWVSPNLAYKRVRRGMHPLLAVSAPLGSRPGRTIVVGGTRVPLEDALARSGVTEEAFRRRVAGGMPEAEAASMPPPPRGLIRTPDGALVELRPLLAAAGLRKCTYAARRRRGMDPYLAATTAVEPAATPRTVVSPGGETLSVRHLLKAAGLSRRTFASRVAEGLDPYVAATTPPLQRGLIGTPDGGTARLGDLLRFSGVRRKTYVSRVRKGMDPYLAATSPPVESQRRPARPAAVRQAA